jgi:hypothetical protein
VLPVSSSLAALGLNPKNSVVIGSGILNALGLRRSRDIDVVATETKYRKLASNSRFRREQSHGREILIDGLCEIGVDWTVLGKTWNFNDLNGRFIVIDNVRYITLEFLFEAKCGWIKDGTGRPKDIDDVKLMEAYLLNIRNQQ